MGNLTPSRNNASTTTKGILINTAMVKVMDTKGIPTERKGILTSTAIITRPTLTLAVKRDIPILTGKKIVLTSTSMGKKDILIVMGKVTLTVTEIKDTPTVRRDIPTLTAKDILIHMGKKDIPTVRMDILTVTEKDILTVTGKVALTVMERKATLTPTVRRGIHIAMERKATLIATVTVRRDTLTPTVRRDIHTVMVKKDILINTDKALLHPIQGDFHRSSYYGRNLQ